MWVLGERSRFRFVYSLLVHAYCEKTIVTRGTASGGARGGSVTLPLAGRRVVLKAGVGFEIGFDRAVENDNDDGEDGLWRTPTHPHPHPYTPPPPPPRQTAGATRGGRSDVSDPAQPGPSGPWSASSSTCLYREEGEQDHVQQQVLSRGCAYGRSARIYQGAQAVLGARAPGVGPWAPALRRAPADTANMSWPITSTEDA